MFVHSMQQTELELIRVKFEQHYQFCGVHELLFLVLCCVRFRSSLGDLPLILIVLQSSISFHPLLPWRGG